MNRHNSLISLIIIILLKTFSASLIKSYDGCLKDSDCDYLNYCDLKEKRCTHKDFYPPSKTEILGSFLIIFGSALSNAGGIGGGGLLIPILLFCLHFSPQESIPISKLMIFTGALTSFFMGLKNKNPFRDSVPVDLNLAIVTIPFLLFGTMIGVTLNKITPPWIILFSLTLVLIINTWKTVNKASNLWKEETNEKEIKDKMFLEEEKSRLNVFFEDESTYDSNNSSPFFNNKIAIFSVNSSPYRKDTINTAINSDYALVTENNQKFKSEVLEEIRKDVCLFNYKLIFPVISYSLLLIISLLKGSDHFHSIIGIKR